MKDGACCELCGVVVSCVGALNRHRVRVHKLKPWKDAGPPNAHSCVVCRKTFRRDWNLVRHQLRLHQVSATLNGECCYCTRGGGSVAGYYSMCCHVCVSYI